MTDTEEFLEMLKNIHNYCKDSKFCENCVFSDNVSDVEYVLCNLLGRPSDWKIEKIKETHKTFEKHILNRFIKRSDK